MKIKYYLPGLYQCEQTNKKSSLQVDETKYPKIAAFLNDLDSFCRKYCNSLDEYIVREKRFLDFDTPNRAVITHEYDIKLESEDSINKLKPYYLFNPIKRLGWLKIYADEERLIVAGEKEVKDIIRDALFNELTDSVYSFETLWQNKVGLPCFVFLKDIDEKFFILTASYYDSLTTYDKECHIKLLFSPLKERDIKYDYLPLKGRSSWLYLKAPDNFDIETKIKEKKTEDYSIEISGGGKKQPDPDILSMTIIHKERNAVKIEKIPIPFSIVLPKTVALWFNVIYWCTVIPALLLLSDIVNTLLLKFVKPIIPIDIPGLICNNVHFTEWLLAIVAAVIATRSWMIKEETILKFYSRAITIVLVCTILLYFIVFLVL